MKNGSGEMLKAARHPQKNFNKSLACKDYCCNLKEITPVIKLPMSQLPRISEAEWEIMKICWARSPITAQDIIDTLAVTDAWHPKT